MIWPVGCDIWKSDFSISGRDFVVFSCVRKVNTVFSPFIYIYREFSKLRMPIRYPFLYCQHDFNYILDLISHIVISLLYIYRAPYFQNKFTLIKYKISSVKSTHILSRNT